MSAFHPAAADPRYQACIAAPSPSPVATHVAWDSFHLFHGTQEVRINHEGQEYRLRQTRNGKLILTK
jgi:hemin uptake protein HemP